MESTATSFWDQIVSLGESAIEAVSPIVQQASSTALEVWQSDYTTSQTPTTPTTTAQAQATEQVAGSVATQNVGVMGFVSNNPEIALGGAALAALMLVLLARR